MASGILPWNDGLRSSTRLRFLTAAGDSIQAWEWLVLIGAGIAAAAATAFLDYNLRIPGHAILRVVFPMAVGLAVVPRRGAGTVMGGAALLTNLGLRLAGNGGETLSLGALTSLTATGPLLDWTMRREWVGWRLYAGFALAGLESNLLAFLVRGAAKVSGFERAGGRPLASWLQQAVVTYTLCGLVAGLVSGVIWFYAKRRHRPPVDEGAG